MQIRLAENIRALRRQHRFTQEQLAEILEVSRQAVSKWENGDSAPDLDRLRAICTYFGVTTDYLIWDEPEDAPQGAVALLSYKYNDRKIGQVYLISASAAEAEANGEPASDDGNTA